MATQLIQDCIRGILADYCDLNAASDLDLSLSIRDDLAIDSLTFVSIILRLEDVFQVDLLESGFELHTIHTIEDLVNVARRLQSSKNPVLKTTTHHKESA